MKKTVLTTVSMMALLGAIGVNTAEVSAANNSANPTASNLGTTGHVIIGESKDIPPHEGGGTTDPEDPDKDIHFYINSPGGSVTAGMGIYDTMQYIKPDVSTICVGSAASMGAFLLSAGAKGKRFALPNAEIMIHQPSGGTQGQATDIKIQASRILKMKEVLNKILSEKTGQPLDVIERDTDRDTFMSAYEAKDYGLIDEVIETRL